jgi:lethal(2) giant larvae protein
VIFSGGMPRASHSDKYTVTVMQGENEHVVFDFTSKVIDFITLSAGDDQPNLAGMKT